MWCAWLYSAGIGAPATHSITCRAHSAVCAGTDADGAAGRCDFEELNGTYIYLLDMVVLPYTRYIVRTVLTADYTNAAVFCSTTSLRRYYVNHM